MWSGLESGRCGCQGHGVAECFEFSDVVAFAGIGASVLVVVVGAEVDEVGVGV